jgi:hypothetical protein
MPLKRRLRKAGQKEEKTPKKEIGALFSKRLKGGLEFMANGASSMA